MIPRSAVSGACAHKSALRGSGGEAAADPVPMTVFGRFVSLLALRSRWALLRALADAG